MKLYSIEDGYLFKTDQPKGTCKWSLFGKKEKHSPKRVPKE